MKINGFYKVIEDTTRWGEFITSFNEFQDGRMQE